MKYNNVYAGRYVSTHNITCDGSGIKNLVRCDTVKETVHSHIHCYSHKRYHSIEPYQLIYG